MSAAPDMRASPGACPARLLSRPPGTEGPPLPRGTAAANPCRYTRPPRTLALFFRPFRTCGSLVVNCRQLVHLLFPSPLKPPLFQAFLRRATTCREGRSARFPGLGRHGAVYPPRRVILWRADPDLLEVGMEGSERQLHIGRDYMGIEPSADRPLSEADVGTHRDLAIGNFFVSLSRLVSAATSFIQLVVEQERGG